MEDTFDVRFYNRVLEAAGWDVNEDNNEQIGVLMQTMLVYVDRNEKYKNTWEQYGALSQLVRAAQKIDRLMSVWWFEPGLGDLEEDADRMPLSSADLDDAIDCINHLIFFIRCAQNGNLFGDRPERPPLVKTDGLETPVVNQPLQLLPQLGHPDELR